MAFRNTILLFGCLCLSFSQGADTLRMPSPIDSVLLYSSQAEVTRHVSGSVPQGTHWVKIPKISAYAQARSARVALSGAIRLHDIRLQQETQLSPQNHPRLQKALEKRDKHQAKLRALQAREEGLEAQKDLLRANQQQDYSSLAQLEERAAFFTRKIKALQEKLLALQEEVQEAQEALQNQQRRVEKLRRALKRSNHYWLLKIESPRSANISLALRYLVGNVSWRSTYRATRLPGQDSLLLEHRAIIKQGSGVAWQAVKIALALGEPLQRSQLPELPPYFIEKPRPVRSRTQTDGGKVKTSYMAVAYTSPLMAPALVERGTFRRFQLRQPLSLGPDNPQVERPLRRYTLPASYRYESHPAQHPAAFLQAQLTGFAGLPLPAGPLKRYHDDTFVGEQHWDPRLSKDTLSLSLGRDADVQVNRRRIERYKEYKVLGQKKELTLRQEITLRNDKSHPIELLVREPLPVSRTEKVSVKRLDQGGRWDKEKGHLIYQIELAPGEKKTLRPGYRVTAPKDFPLRMP
ncbi:MAG: mucoidy inhibitor MuiA family protein [Schleiferiaceae bacterium]|nr:mucoidy inhibitor MuiA family protein [Schleiferiaceae bacterium]